MLAIPDIPEMPLLPSVREKGQWNCLTFLPRSTSAAFHGAQWIAAKTLARAVRAGAVSAQTCSLRWQVVIHQGLGPHHPTIHSGRDERHLLDLVEIVDLVTAGELGDVAVWELSTELVIGSAESALQQ